MMRNGQSATFQLLFQQFLLGTSVPRIIQSSFILIRISIEVSMYLKIISISDKVGKWICMLDSATPTYPCLSLPTTSPQYPKNRLVTHP